MTETSRLTWNSLKQNVCDYIGQQYRVLLGFTFVNMLFLAVMFWGGGVVGTLWFLGWMAAYYLFNFIFFRYFFARKPYLLTEKFFDTLVPASKILFTLMLLLTLLAYLPYLPLLFVGMSDNLKNLITAFIGDFMGESNIYNVLISLILLLCSPFILYRPIMAWIAAVIGRSGLIKPVLRRTEGYYRLFLLVGAVFYFFASGVQLLDTGLHLHGYLFWMTMAPLTVLLNVVLAKTYEMLFLD